MNNEWEDTNYYLRRYGKPEKGRVIVFEQHGTDNAIFQAETWEQITDAMMAIVLDRASYGYYECNKKMEVPEKPFTDEEYAAAPARMKHEYDKIINQWKYKVKIAEDNNHLYECLKTIKEGGEWARNAVYFFCDMRSDYEDEQFWMDTAEDPSAYLAKVKERLKKKECHT